MSGLHANYLGVLFDQSALSKALKEARALLKGVKFDGFLARGNSGIVFASILAFRMKKRLVVSRKPDEKSHSSYEVENTRPGDRLIFVDDGICSGRTLQDATAATLKAVNYDFTFAGGILYGMSAGFPVEFKSAKEISIESKIQIRKETEAAKLEAQLREKQRAREQLKKDSYKGNNPTKVYMDSFPTDLTVVFGKSRKKITL